MINDQGKYCMRIVIGVLVIQSGVEAAEDFASVLTLDVLGTLYFHSHLHKLIIYIKFTVIFLYSYLHKGLLVRANCLLQGLASL